MSEYYVTVEGDRIAGPFDSRDEAQRYADEQSTNEIMLTYDVERA